MRIHRMKCARSLLSLIVLPLAVALVGVQFATAQTSNLVVTLEQCTAYDTLGGDTEFTSATLRNSEVGLVTYVTDTNNACVRNNANLKNIFVRPLNIYTGVPEPVSQAVLVGTDECGNLRTSNGEWGSTATNEPLLAYTAAVGVRIVQVKPKTGGGITFANQTIPGSDKWMTAGIPLSSGFTPVQLKSMQVVDQRPDSYIVRWSKINATADGTILGTVPIHNFAAGDTSIRSQLHPTDPDKFIRVSLDNKNIYEYSVTAGADIAPIDRQQGAYDIIRAWKMPVPECASLGLDDAPTGCPAIVMSARNIAGSGRKLLWKARARDGTWREIIRVPYSEEVRVVPTVITHLDSPRSVVLATGEGDARLYLADGNAYTVISGGVRTKSSESLYFSTSQLMGVYVQTQTNIPTVCMVKFQGR